MVEISKMNPYQRAAVMDESAACLVNANVGSGKTTVLIEKVRYLHEEKKIPYADMVVLTFTNKAADEIMERLRKRETELTEEDLWGFGTFHSVALRILQRFLPENGVDGAEGWNREFTVITPEEEIELLLNLVKETRYKIKYQNRLQKRLESDYEAYRKGGKQGKYKDDLFRIFPLLDERKRKENKMSFADLIREGTRIAKEYANQLHLQWIIVDEVQDSDEKQLDFIEALREEQTKFFAVGDPNQVIYSWRGTGPNMFFMIKHKLNAKELFLPVNYRSSEVILEAANRFLQFGGKIEGGCGTGDKILVKNHYDAFTEAEYLISRIRELHEQGLEYSKIAIFYRMQEQAELLEKAFSRAKLPFIISTKQISDDEPTPEQAIRLMTLHASKGLEYDYVFIIGMNQGLMPLRCKDMEQEEEERRLFFVGITRARKNLELSYYTNPTIPGVFGAPSNYLKMLPESLLDWEDKPGSEERRGNLQKLRKETKALMEEKKQEKQAQESLEVQREEVQKQEIQEVQVRKGRHPKYGEGVILSEDEMMIELDFPGYGKKQFLKAFGEVEILI